MELIGWFDDLANNRPVKYRDLGFTEPNLEFQVMENQPNLKKVRISFFAESKPKSANKEDEYFVDCLFNNKELGIITSQLRDEANAFPPR